jgi:uncharacterized protein YcbX
MKVETIWRYPVKSMGGQQIESTMLTHHGVIGDRSYAIHDGTTTRGAKKLPRLMNFNARFDAEPDGTEPPGVTIQLPGAEIVNSNDDDIDQQLSDELGTNVRLDKLRPATDLNYYEAPKETRSVEEIRDILGLLPEEPFPDFSEFPKELGSYSTPPGTFFDAYPLLILTTAAIEQLQNAATESVIDPRRFRPNIVIATESGITGYIEETWRGKYLQIGDAIIELTLPCPRCVMTTIGFGDLPKDPKIMRTLVAENNHKLGIYGQVIKPGKISQADTATLLDNFDNEEHT